MLELPGTFGGEDGCDCMCGRLASGESCVVTSEHGRVKVESGVVGAGLGDVVTDCSSYKRGRERSSCGKVTGD